MFIHQALQHAVRLYGEREAVVSGSFRCTYRDLGERVQRLAGRLVLRHALKADERVALLLLNDHHYLEAYFAVEWAGGIAVPLNHRLAPAEIAAISADAGTALFIVDEQLRPLFEAALPALGPQQVIWAPAYDDDLTDQPPLAEPARAWQDGDTAQLYYTSGATGRPKGVMLTQRNVMQNAFNAIAALGFTGDDIFLHAAPMFHLADAWSCWTITMVGGRHVFLREFTPGGLLDLVQTERVTATLIVPTMINAIINHPEVGRFDTSSLRIIGYGASPMPVDRLLAAMKALPCQFTQLYGMTETAPFATQLRPEEADPNGSPVMARRLLSCGRELPGVQARVVRPDGSEVEPDEVGEIVMRGDTIMAGYWRQPEETARALAGGWMHSGDLATVDRDGFIYIVDRRKDMIISGGENVYSTEVEDALYKHPAVLEAAVIGVPDDRWGERVHAVVVLRPGQRAAAEELADFCRQHIAGYKIPRSVAFSDALPKTGSGKIQKSVLREPYWQGQERRV